MSESYKKNSTIPRVIAVVSGKGGTGKTFVAVNLASAFYREGKQVVLLDGDFGLANVHLLMGEKPEKNLEEVLAGQCEMKDILLPTTEGFTIIPAGRGRSLMAQLHPHQLIGLIAAVDGLEAPPDVLLLDTAGTISVEELQFIAAAGEVIIVTTPDLLSLQDAAEYIRQLHIRHHIQRFSIVANMTKNHREAHNMLEKLQNLVGFDVDVVLKPLGHVSLDDAARKSMSCLSSVIESEPDSKAAKQLFSIAKKISEDTSVPLLGGGLSFFYEKNLRAGGV